LNGENEIQLDLPGHKSEEQCSVVHTRRFVDAVTLRRLQPAVLVTSSPFPLSLPPRLDRSNGRETHPAAAVPVPIHPSQRWKGRTSRRGAVICTPVLAREQGRRRIGGGFRAGLCCSSVMRCESRQAAAASVVACSVRLWWLRWPAGGFFLFFLVGGCPRVPPTGPSEEIRYGPGPFYRVTPYILAGRKPRPWRRGVARRRGGSLPQPASRPSTGTVARWHGNNDTEKYFKEKKQ